MTTNACPFCKEMVHAAATVCPHCQHTISKAALVGRGLMSFGCVFMIAVPVLLFVLLLLVGLFSS